MQPLVTLVFHNLPSLYPTSFRRNDFLYLCYNQPIYEDNCLELNEYAGLTLGVIDNNNVLTTVLTNVEPMNDQASILILDNESTKVQNPRRNSYAVNTYTSVVYILRMRVRVLRCPDSPVSRLFTPVAPVASL